MVPVFFFAFPLLLTAPDHVEQPRAHVASIADARALFPKAADIWHLVGQATPVPVTSTASRYAQLEEHYTRDPMLDFAAKYSMPRMHYVHNDTEVSLSLGPGSCTGPCVTLQGLF